MDVKAMAKSKRAHTQHHSKKPHTIHQSHKHKAPPDATSDSGTAKNKAGKQVVEKTQKAQKVVQSLPSNWDRYEEELDSDPFGWPAGNTQDIILPKSKGSDYRYLIQEANSEAEQNAFLNVTPSFDDFLSTEFSRGIGSMLAVRGESMLSWIGDDNFIVEDKTSTSNEASFLSLNLNALADALAKVDLAKRLFVDPDLLPPELSGDDYANGESRGTHEELSRDELCKKADDLSEKVAFDTSTCSDIYTTLLKKYPTSENYVSIDRGHVDISFQSEDPKSRTLTCTDSTSDLSKKTASFETTYAERELDMLLDSFNEIKILHSSDSRSDTFVPVFREEASASHFQISRTGPGPSKTNIKTINLDDALDDLLEETSNVMNQLSLSQVQHETVVSIQSSSSQTGTKPKVLDDFDSWFDTIR